MLRARGRASEAAEKLLRVTVSDPNDLRSAVVYEQVLMQLVTQALCRHLDLDRALGPPSPTRRGMSRREVCLSAEGGARFEGVAWDRLGSE